MKKRLAFILVIVFLLSFAGCGQNEICTEVNLGENLPVLELSTPLTREALPEDAAETGLTGIYKSDEAGIADIYIYRYPAKDGVSLEDFGKEQAEKNKVFCNMTTFLGYPTANISYCETAYGTVNIVRSYLFEAEDEFVKLCFVYNTTQIELGNSGYTVGMIDGYTEKENVESVFPTETVYEYDDEYLPTVRVREFAADDFTAADYDAAFMPGTDKEQFADYAADGWTLEEFVSFYDDNYELMKGEIFSRNGLDVGFVGYIDEGIFYVRALIDCGDDYIMLCTENDTEHFQHIANALIDTIKQ